MSPRPVLEKLVQHIDKMGGDSWLLDRIAAGETPGSIAASISLPKHGTISRPLLYLWRNAGGTDRREAWKHAMESRGELLVEEAGEVLDKLADGTMPTSSEVALARARSEYKWKLGAKLNDDYADKPPEVNIAVITGPEAFHAALAKHGKRQALPIPTADYEIVEETE